MTSTHTPQDAAVDVTPIEFVLITPARNEAEMIGRTIEAVVAQERRPLRWVIVSDGSTDGTDDIVSRFAKTHPWIELLRRPERERRHFAGKAHAFNAGYERLRKLEFEVVGNLDADITFDPDYFTFLISRFEQDAELGVAGTPFSEGVDRYDYRYTSIEHVSGACQLFRRNCFEDVGGYVPLESGGVDLVAVMTARMKGWKTRTFLERSCVHHRKMGTAEMTPLRGALKGGKCDYILGTHPLWEFSRCFYQMTRRPYIVAGALRMVAFFWTMASGAPKCISRDLIQFRRAEQMRRLHEFFAKSLGLGRERTTQERG